MTIYNIFSIYDFLVNFTKFDDLLTFYDMQDA